MKKVSLIIVGLISLATFYNFAIAKESDDSMQEIASDYIVMRYTAYGYGGKNSVIIHYGNLKIEKLDVPKEMLKESGTTNFVIDLLNQFNAKGYTLVSTTLYGTGENAEVACFLKKSK